MSSVVTIDAYILIGGRSSRFGSDKAFARFGTETLLARAVRTVNDGIAPSRTTLVVSRDGQFDSEELASFGCPAIADTRPGLGAWSGIDAALSHAQTHWILVLACDLPFISAEFLRFLASKTREGADAVVPRQPDGRLQPLCAFYRVEAAREAASKFLVEPADLPPLVRIFERLNTCVVLDDEFTGTAVPFTNINTTADLTAAAEMEYHQVPDPLNSGGKI